MPLALEKARTSCEETKVPPEMETVADSRFVSSTSVMVREESMTVAPSPSEKARVPPAPEITGASLAAATEMVEVAAEESAVPSLTTQEMVRIGGIGIVGGVVVGDGFEIGRLVLSFGGCACEG